MFYSEAILSRRGPLAKVWLAAHMERKLSKTQTLQTDIEQSVGAIMGQEVEVMALRLSGQLLLGVVRIYSRKAKYLLDDCNEALLKIKMAFRPGIVDMTEDQLAVNRNAITLQGGDLDLDLLLPDINWDVDFEDRPLQPQGQHVARMADITLATTDDLPFDLDDPGYGFDLGPSDGIGSQDFDLDLGLDFGDGPASVNGNDMSIEVGRDAAAPRLSLDSNILGNDGMDVDLDLLSNRSKSRAGSEHPFRLDMDIDFGPDLGGMNLDLGGDQNPFSDREKTPGQTRSSSRASSPLTEPPVTPPPEENIPSHPESPTKMKRKHKEKKQIIDAVTELKDGPGPKGGRGNDAGLGAPMTKDVSNILTEQHFLPRSSVVIRLLEIRDDPLAHFLPTKVTPNGTFLCTAPPGLAPELADMFLQPMQNTLATKRRGLSPEKGANKRPRLDGSMAGDDEIEIARRAGSLAPSVLGSDILGRGSIAREGGLDFGDNIGIGVDDFQMDVGGFDMGGGDMDPERARSKSAAPTDRSRMSTPAADGVPVEDGDETYADATCPIAMFDIRPSSQSQGEEHEAEIINNEGKGYSKNTIKALSVIRKELQPFEGQEKVLSFRKMSDKASRRAASSFFFELLVLGTRDCIHLSQADHHENIEVRAKDKLWERQRHGSMPPSRHASVAPSRAGSVAPSQHDNVVPPRHGSVAPSIASSMGL